MQSITIMKAGPYELVSLGNGLAYELINHGNENGAPWSLFVQGDDATQFRQELDNMEAARPSMPSRDVLGYMWATMALGQNCSNGEKAMSNRLKAYVRRTLLTAAKEYAAPKARRTADSTRSALQDATRGTDTGWWCDLIYTAPMLAMAHKYRRDIAAALAEYRDAAGEPYEYRERNSHDDRVIREGDILSALLKARKPYTLADYRREGDGGPAECALIGLRFAVEWYAGEIARELCPDF